MNNTNTTNVSTLAGLNIGEKYWALGYAWQIVGFGRTSCGRTPFAIVRLLDKDRQHDRKWGLNSLNFSERIGD